MNNKNCKENAEVADLITRRSYPFLDKLILIDYEAMYKRNIFNYEPTKKVFVCTECAKKSFIVWYNVSDYSSKFDIAKYNFPPQKCEATNCNSSEACIRINLIDIPSVQLIKLTQHYIERVQSREAYLEATKYKQPFKDKS